MTTARKKVLITDITWSDTDIESSVLERAGAEAVLAPEPTEERLAELAQDADAILTCFARVPEAVIAAAPRLQVIGRYGVGTDNIAVDAASRREVIVSNVPEYCTDEVSEHVLAFLLSLARGIHLYDRAVRNGDWRLETGLPVRRVAGQTLGVIGFGAIGRALSARASTLGLRVLVFDAHPDRARAAGFEPVGLDELADRADFVSLHVPLTESTRKLVNDAFLDRMKPTAYLINCARGGVVDTDALARALDGGLIAGAALDVFDPEPLPGGHRLLASPRLLATPHTAFHSAESIATLARLAAENVAAVLTGRRPAATVNPEVLSAPRWAHLQT
jgi:D-3-phosphoglycerate dehydrogenase